MAPFAVHAFMAKNTLAVAMLLAFVPLAASKSCSKDEDCQQGEVCVPTLFGKSCKPFACPKIEEVFKKHAVAAGFLELRVRNLPANVISIDNPYGKPFETMEPKPNEILDWSDCGGWSGNRPTCELRCRGPKYVSTTATLKLICHKNGSVTGPWPADENGQLTQPLCVPIYSRTDTVLTQQGPIRGIRRPFGCKGDCIDTYFDVPYARPPMGELRFRPPQRLTKFDETTRDLPSQPGEGCLGWDGHTGSVLGKKAEIKIGTQRDPEDCLYLHMYVPRDTFPNESLPVLFNIFGGGFIVGDAWEGGLYDGAGVAKMSRSIFVSPNFRIGLLGHMALKGLKDSDPQQTTGNYGLQDQRAALEWVRRNIKAFGGDPGRVHIFGLSSGAFSVQYHRLSPRSIPLFSSALSVSGAQVTEWYFQRLDEADAFYSVLSDEAGCPTKGKTPREIRSCLIGLNTNDLFNATRRNGFATQFNKGSFYKDLLQHWVSDVVPSGGGTGVRPFNDAQLAMMGLRIPMLSNPMFPLLPAGPCIDGSDEGLPAAPRDLMREGKTSKAPLINLFNKNEGSMFVPIAAMAFPHADISFPLTHDGVDVVVEAIFPDRGPKIVGELYSRSRWPNADERMDAMISDALFGCSNRFTAIENARHDGPRVYLVEWRAKFNSIWSHVFGSAHAESAAHLYYYSSDTGFWPTEGTWEKSPEQAQLAVWLSCAHARLTHCGDPRACDGIEIPACLDLKRVKNVAQMQPYSMDSDERLVVDSAAGSIPGILPSTSWAEHKSFSEEEKSRCDFWEKEPFHFVSAFYNQKPDWPDECMGSAKLPGATHWLRCGQHQHVCLDGYLDGCCCDAGYRDSGRGSCVACKEWMNLKALMQHENASALFV